MRRGVPWPHDFTREAKANTSNRVTRMTEDITRPGPGHNGIGGEHLLSFIERVERLNEDLKTVKDEIKDVYAEAKGTGYDVKILRKLVGLRSQDADKRREEQAILELYAEAIGMEV